MYFQLESLQNEAEKLQDEKPEEAQAIREKIAEINNVWMDLKEMVSFIFILIERQDLLVTDIDKYGLKTLCIVYLGLLELILTLILVTNYFKRNYKLS